MVMGDVEFVDVAVDVAVEAHAKPMRIVAHQGERSPNRATSK